MQLRSAPAVVRDPDAEERQRFRDAGAFPAMLSSEDTSFQILHCRPAESVESRWRAFLTNADFATHYAAPEYFLEPALRAKKPFAVLSVSGDEITGVLTGIHDGDRLQSGLSVRPQIAVSRSADRSRAIRNLISGLIREAESAELVDLFTWPNTDELIDRRFRQKRYEGVVMLDLTQGANALFRKFSENKRRNIKKAIKVGLSVDLAKSRDDIAAYYAIYVQWSRRKGLPIVGEEAFHETLALWENRRLFLARHEGQIIAGVVVRFSPGGVMEYAANSSLEQALHLRPNDLLHWRAIEWACAEGMIKYSLGGTHLFLRKFGGEIVPTIRHRLDLSTFRRYALGDWIAGRAEAARLLLPQEVVALGRTLRSEVERLRRTRRPP